MFKPCYKQSTSANKIKFKPSDMCQTLSLAFSAISSFSQFLSHEANMVASYHVVLMYLLAMLCLDNYKQCCMQLLKVLHKWCNMDVLRVLLIYPHSPLGATRLQEVIYISVKPLAAVLQYTNVCMYVRMCSCVCLYV